MGVGDEVKDQLSFLGGFKLTFQHLTRPRVTTKYPDEKKPKQPRQHGRHVLNRYEDGMEKCIGCELCAGVCPADCIYVRGLDNPPDHPVSPGRALRLRLRDQLPALHPLRHVRRGLPDRGHHRVQALRVLLHQPLRRHLHQGRARRERRRHAEEAALGGLARGRRPDDVGLDARHVARRAAPPTRARCSGRASSATACARPEGGQSAHRDDEATGTKPLREVLEAHLLDEDIPLAHRGMQGRVWRAKEGAAANRKKMDATRARMKELRASRKAAKAEAKATEGRGQGGDDGGRGERGGRRSGDRRRRGERLTHAPRRAPPGCHARHLARHPGLRRRRGGDPGRRRRRRHVAQPGARRAQPRHDALRGGRPLH